MWNREQLEDLVTRAKSFRRSLSGRNKSKRAAKRSSKLLRKKHFARASQLGGSIGVAEANEGTIKGIGPMFLELGVVPATDFIAYYGPPTAPLAPSIVTLALLRECIDAIPPLWTPRKDGWRNEHLCELVRAHACGDALATLMTIVVTCDVPAKMAGILSFATLIVMLK
jgi:hypothetical protein